jgi:hypothetical protein
MARLHSIGFELQSVTDGMEWDTTTGSPTISTSVVHGGAASLRVNPSGAAWYITHQYKASGASNNDYLRFYFRIATANSGSAKAIALFRSSGSGNLISLRINSTNTLELWNEQISAQLGSDSSALSTDTWYRIELELARDSGTAHAYIDGKEFASAAMSFTALNTSDFRVGIIDSDTCDFYFDDIAVNDNTGTAQNFLPGPGKIVHLRPNATGDSETAGIALTGDTPAWKCIDDVTPDDATTYIAVAATSDTLDVNLDDSSTAGIASTDIVTLVAVGQRFSATTAAACSINMRVRSASGGTTATSGNVTVAVTAWNSFDDAAPKVYKLTSYTDPTTGVPWTPTGTNSLDNAQIGFSSADATPDPKITAMWLLVEYDTPNAGGTISLIGTSQAGNASNGGDVTLTFDGTPAKNDVVLLFGGSSRGPATGYMTDPSTTGYTRIISSFGGITNPSVAVWYKVLGASPDASVTGVGTADSAMSTAYISFVLRGVDTTILDGGISKIEASAVPNANAVLTRSAGAWVLVLGAVQNSDSSVGSVSGYSNQATTVGSDTTNITVAGATKTIAASAVEDPGAWSTWTSGNGVAIALALRPGPLLIDSVSDTATITESVAVSIQAAGGANTVSVSDTITITENKVTLIEFLLVNVNDTITITENKPVYLESYISKSDTATVTENVVRLEESRVSVSDTITVTESIKVELTSFVNKSDTITVTESIGRMLESYINVSDTATITESVSAAITTGDTGVSVSDTITLTESIGRLVESYINKSDTITVTENKVVLIPELLVNVNDTVTLTESIGRLLTSSISVSDTATLTESIGRLLESYVNKTENITLTESIGRLVESYVNKSESITVTENAQATRPLTINVSDTVTLTESLLLLDTEGIGVLDNIAVSENIVMFTDKLYLSVSDTVTISESVGRLVESYINKSDTITITENVSVSSAGDRSLSVSDTITVTESVGVIIPTLSIRISDNITLTESVSVQEVVSKSISDTITVTESVTVRAIAPPAFVSLTVTLSAQPLAITLTGQPSAVTLKDDPSLAITLTASALSATISGRPLAVTLQSQATSVTLKG